MPLRGLDDVKKGMQEVVASANKDVRGVYLAGLKNIIEGTPVDTGRARNNWFLSVGTPNTSSTTNNSNGLISNRQLSRMPKEVIGKKIYFTNNLPYVGVLEYGGFSSPVQRGSYIKRTRSYQKLSSEGFSKQAPAGWVRISLIKMTNKIRSL